MTQTVWPLLYTPCRSVKHAQHHTLLRNQPILEPKPLLQLPARPPFRKVKTAIMDLESQYAVYHGVRTIGGILAQSSAELQGVLQELECDNEYALSVVLSVLGSLQAGVSKTLLPHLHAVAVEAATAGSQAPSQGEETGVHPCLAERSWLQTAMSLRCSRQVWFCHGPRACTPPLLA